MFKKTLILTSILSLLIAGCSSDNRYKREVTGNDDYLKSPELKPIIVPQGLTIPKDSSEYYIYKAAKEGNTGKDVDIRPPALPLANIADAYTTYENGVITLDVPEYNAVWQQIPAILRYHNIEIEKSNNTTIKTGKYLINNSENSQTFEAVYLLQRKVQSGREYINFELTSLRSQEQNVTDPIESQRAIVDFFNMIMSNIESTQINN
ncbi:outer membrane protein assembly factor BamC [Orbaceae bacterium ac157xtp]